MIIRKYSLFLMFLLSVFFLINIACAGESISVSSNTSAGKQVKKAPSAANKKNKRGSKKVSEFLVTFVELGSVKCIPCKMMQPIMKEIEEEYKGRVKVVFYDVWTEEGSPYAKKYAIRAIPTQVFLDRDGKEFFRHTGFFPKEEIVKIFTRLRLESPSRKAGD